MPVLARKLKEVLTAVGPLSAIVLFMGLTFTPLESSLIIRFIIGSVFVVVGLTVFLIGVNVGITPIGNHMGSILAKRNNLFYIITGGLILGFLISVAEPDLHILAQQVSLVTGGLLSKLTIVTVVSVGVALILTVGFLRIVYNKPIHLTFAIIYGLILILGIFASAEFLAIAFDASGATTGALSTPFFLALGYGVSSLKKDSKASEEDSFGLVGLASAGAILGVLVMSVFRGKAGLVAEEITTEIEHVDSIFLPFVKNIPGVAFDVFLALAPILLLFIIFQFVTLKLRKKTLATIIVGTAITFVGMVLFLTGVNAGFMEAAYVIGKELVGLGNKYYAVLMGFALGLFTILAEPAVHVLTDQVEQVTSGYVKKSLVKVTLSIGVGLAMGLSILRTVVPGIQLWHYLLPGYIISILLSFFAPKLFVGVAFDSGGVASGPMTATFILAFSQGVADMTPTAEVLADGFGIIAMVAMMPIISLQLLGLVYLYKSKKGEKKKHG
ncbi:MAG TPA: DUF1538 domain-containing protein [Clostridiales bacterium]|nr:DUF1538 domain-containing protein [Clostridiales bacterium]